MRRCQMPNLAIFAGCLTLKAFGMVPILAAAVVQPPPVAVEPTPYWAAPNGLAYDLRSIFHEVLRFRVRGDPRRRVEVSLGGAVLCTPRTNPRRVAVCAHDVDGTPAVLGLKANFRFEEMADPEGFRLWYEHQSQSFTLDFFCSETEFPATLDYLDRITDPEITGFAASYFGRITSVVGCGFVLPDFGESEAAEPDHSGPGLVWRALVGGQSFRYSSRSVLGTQLLVELNPPHALDALEISLGSPIPCGMGQDEVVAVCFYPTEQPPVAAGYNASLQLRRAHRGGVDIHLRGAQCTATREYWTHISVVCQARGEASSLWAWRSDGAGCDLFVEMVSPLGCGIETGTKPAAHSAPQESLEVRGDNPSPDSDMTEFQPDVNTFGCVDGNCENGQGTFRWRTDSTYHGTWLNGMRYGHGEHEWPDGRKYIGDWSNNVRSGWGTHRFANRDVYTGKWERDMKHGSGSYTWVDGGTYNGTFTDDQLSGEGDREWPNGGRYAGAFHDGLQHGYGAMVWSNGTKWIGVWSRGQPTDDGMMLCVNRLLFRGGCIEACPSGHAESHGECIDAREDL